MNSLFLGLSCCALFATFASAQSIEIIPTAPTTPERIQPLPAPDVIEAEFWSSVKDSTDPSEIRLYLERYPNGAFTPLALRRLVALEGADQTPEPAPQPAEPRFARSQILKVQEQLNILGYNAGVEDGLMGQRTRNAISAFQGAQGVTRNGVLSRDVIARLNRSVSEDRLASYRAQKNQRRTAAAAPAPAAPSTPTTTTRATPATTLPSAGPRIVPGDPFCKTSSLNTAPANGANGANLDCIVVERITSNQLKFTTYRKNSKGEVVSDDWGTYRARGETFYGPRGEFSLKGTLLQRILRDKPAGNYRQTTMTIN